MFDQYKGLPKEIYIIALQRFVNSLGGFVFPFLTMFLSKRIGLEADEVGKIVFIAAIVSIPGALISGAIADRFNRKIIIIIPRILSALIFIVCGFMKESMIIPYLLILSSFLASFSGPATNAMTSDLTTPDNRKQSFSLLYLAMNFGLAFGFMMAGYLFEVNWRWLFWGDGITSLLSLSLLILFVKETKPNKENIEEINQSDRIGEKEEQGSLVFALINRPFLMGFVVVSAIIGFVYNQHSFIMPFQLESLFINQGARFFGYIMTFNTVLVVFLTPLIIHLTKNYKPLVNVIISTCTYVIGFGMLAFAKNMSIFFVSALIWTVGEIIATVNTGVYISNHSPVNHRAGFGAIMGVIFGAGRSLAPYFMGMFLMGHTNEDGWLLTGLVAFICVIFLIGLYKLEESHRLVTAKKKIEVDIA